jgi:ABC-type dipeptide/oligopeptide/nickel transport system permease subunit
MNRQNVSATIAANLGEDLPLSKRPSMFKRLGRDRVALVSAGVLTFIVLGAIFAPLVAPYEPDQQQLALRLQGAEFGDHPFGTDQFGRDVLSRLLWGGRNSLQLALIPVIATFVVATALGLLAGLAGGWIDQVVMRLADMLLAFPGLLLAVALAAVFGRSLENAMLALTIVSIPGLTRVVRAATRVISAEVYIAAARSVGATEVRIAVLHVAPNLLSISIVYATLLTGNLIVAGAALSYLGLGVQSPDSDWGSMILDGSQVLAVAPHISVIAGAVIFATAMSLNLLGDSLRDALDPRLRSTID